MIVELFLFLLLIYFISRLFKPSTNLPPGPRGLPFIGTFPYSTIKECIPIRKKYGNLFMIRVGAVNFLYICDYKTAKEALSKLEFSDRPSWRTMISFDGEIRKGKAHGVIFSNGTHWLHNRRFLMRHLRDLGMGKSKIEGIIMREVEDLVEEFKKLTKGPSKLPFSINVAVLNIIWQLVSSHRYEFHSRQVENLMEDVDKIQDAFVTLAIPNFYPIVKYILPKPILHYLTGESIFQKTTKKFENLVQPFIDEHLKTLDPSNPRDLMDDYLIEMKEGKSDDYSHFDFIDLIKITFDLFIAGNDTTTNMTHWVLAYMSRFPEVQDKIQKEIDRVVPRDILPGLQHRNGLAYLDASINEVQRHCSMIAMGVVRCTTDDVKLCGYDIPKGTCVLSVADFSHKDPTYFKDPEEFNPSRFLDSSGKYIPTCEGFQAFGIGKRQCLGEQFARMELYLIVAALLQNFTFGPPEGEGPMSIERDNIANFNFPPKDRKFSIKYRT